MQQPDSHIPPPLLSGETAEFEVAVRITVAGVIRVRAGGTRGAVQKTYAMLGMARAPVDLLTQVVGEPRIECSRQHVRRIEEEA